MAGVILAGVEKRFPNTARAAVDRLSLSVQDGEFVVLVGPSGCGKSTTLRMIAGLERQTAGSILIGERNVDRVAPKHRDVAMIFQDYALYPHMTVWDNLAFGLRSRHVKRGEVNRRIPQVADMLELSDLLRRKPGELSGGQRQRVAVGRALVREPRVFLMDEPLSNLDAKLRSAMRVELIKLHRRLGTTIIYVTHDQVEAMTMGSRIAVMHDGVLQQFASPDDIYDAPANKFVASFIGSPSINLLEAGVVADDAGLSLDTPVVRLPVAAHRQVALQSHAGQKVWLGVRPEDLRLHEGQAGVQPFRAQVDVVERMGSETIVHFAAGRSSLVGRFDGRCKLRSGDEVQLAVNPDHVHVFDRTSGAALR